ncbi:MAG: hypothetical protein NTV19_05355 [Burkholderiales bacterium]|nr:hypothetical protein [Burkholderiales bacterium]
MTRIVRAGECQRIDIEQATANTAEKFCLSKSVIGWPDSCRASRGAQATCGNIGL